jgi:hypothetical protein
MITRDDVRTFFVTLTTMGVLAPEPWRTGSDASRAEAIDAAIRGWLDALSDVHSNEFRRAARAYVHTASGYWPMPAQIRALVVETSERRALTSDEAIGYLLGLARRVGSYQPKPAIEGSDATRYGAEAVLASAGGWAGFCGSTVDAAFLARCRRVYEAAIAEEERRKVIARLDAPPRQIESRGRRVIE